MNRFDEFELRIADWLEEGPVDAPEDALVAALEHARSHPRPAHPGVALRRRAMSQLKISQTAPRAPHIGWMLAAAAAIAVLVFGGAAISTDMLGLWKGQSGIGGPTPGPTPVTVRATVSCSTTTEGSSSPVGDITVFTDRVETCALRDASDPRLAGAMSKKVLREQFPDGGYHERGTARLTAGSGRWDLALVGTYQPSGTGSAAASPSTGPMVFLETLIGNGSGSLDGLILHGWIDGEQLVATIRPPATGDAVGSVAITASEAPAWTDVQGVQQLRDYVFGATVSSSDAALIGSGTLTFSSDVRPDGTGAEWATLAVGTAPGPQWRGDLSGSLLADGRHTLTGRITGSGAAAGRSFDITLETTDPPGGWNLLALARR